MTQTAPGTAASYPAAELDRRFYAFAVDRLIAWGVFAGAGYLSWHFLLDRDRVLLGVVAIVATVLAVSLLYAVLLGTGGLSPGKSLVGLRVVRASDGRPIGLSHALVRTAVLGMFTLPTLGLGLATLAWTAVMDPSGRRRGGHDRMTEAVVVDVRPMPAEEEVLDHRPRQIVNLTAMRLMPATAATAQPTTPPTTPPATQPTTPPTSAPAAPRTTQTPTTPPAPAAPAPAPASPPRPTTAPPPTPPTAPTPVPPAPRPTHRAPSPPASVPASVPSAGRWRVAFDTGESFVVEGLALVGRRPEPRPGEPVTHLVPLRSSDMSLSKTHAQFQVVPDGALVVMDRGSTNGSVVVRQGVSKSLTAGRPATLVDGDTVRFGDRTMTVTKLEQP